MPPIRFTKMHGAGNDFIVIDNRPYRLNETEAADLARSQCKRRVGTGADGLLLLDKDSVTSFSMRHYNPDGTRSSFCGNGARCIAQFAFTHGIAPKNLTFAADDGMHSAQVEGHNVRLDMTITQQIQTGQSLTVSGTDYLLYCINTGAPHAVVFAKDVTAVSVDAIGRSIRYHPRFEPEGTNVTFAEPVDSGNLNVRTYEKGVEAETLSCGTGSVAAAIVSNQCGYVTPPISVMTRGGERLIVDFASDGSQIEDVTLEGSAHMVYHGEITDTP